MSSTIPPNVSRLDPVFQKLIKNDVKLKDDEVKEANSELQEVLLNTMLDKMKSTDDTFRVLYKQPHYVGSYYENLRVCHPDEFDINLELQLPVSGDVEIETRGLEPGFAKIKVDSKFRDHTSDAVRRKIESWCENKYLCRDKVFQWLQGIVDRVLSGVKWDQGMTVKRSTSGPAVTLRVRRDSKDFSVDLVPVFMFGRDKWPAPPLRQESGFSSQKWCVVPKSPRQEESSRQLWRMSFYKHEKELMNDQDHMKPVLKLIKLFRDKENRVSLSSYYIKTVFMWEMEEQSDVAGFWRKGLGYLLMHMFGKLKSYLQSGKIPFFWDKRCNLIAHLNQEEIKNIYGRVINARLKLESALSSPDNDLSSVVNELFTVALKNPSRQVETSHQAEDLQQAQPTDWNAVVGTVAMATAAAAAVGIGIWRILARNQRNE